MKKLLMVLGILMLLVSTHAYTSNSTSTQSTVVISESENGIYAMDEELEIEIQLLKEVTKSYEMVEGEKKYLGSRSKVSYDGFSHNIDLTNNSKRQIDNIKVALEIDEEEDEDDDKAISFSIKAPGQIKSGKTKKFKIDLELDQDNITLTKLHSLVEPIDAIFYIYAEDQQAEIHKTIEVTVNTDRIVIEKEKKPEPIVEEDDEKDEDDNEEDDD